MIIITIARMTPVVMAPRTEFRGFMGLEPPLGQGAALGTQVIVLTMIKRLRV